MLREKRGIGSLKVHRQRCIESDVGDAARVVLAGRHGLVLGA